MKDSSERFSNRVEHYTKYRPGYPPEIFDFLASTCGLTTSSRVADIGSGTGKLSEIFLHRGCVVYGVEPNKPMREAAEMLFRNNPNFLSVDGSAETTRLESKSIDIITAGQAFHWFDRQRARAEFIRILKPSGFVVIIWNERRLDSTPFLRDYEKLLLEYGTDYREVRHENVVGEVSSFFLPGSVKLQTFENSQQFDFEGLEGRISSTSYTPEPGSEPFLRMLEALRGVFTRHASEGKVVFEYDTRVYYGSLE